MQIIRQPDALRTVIAGWRRDGARVALVPTMGALHDGHMALLERARALADRVVVSLFVNPRQFGAGEDLARYPRDEAGDAALLTAGGCDLLWAPPVEAIYPAAFATTVSVAGFERLEGALRPGHFDGVATVVAKLFGQVRPDIALFGEKDFQQLALVRRLAADLDLGVEIVAVATVRDPDGLALSSRNAYLTPVERAAAAALPRALSDAAAAVAGGADVAAALAAGRRQLVDAGFSPPDYFELVDEASLAPLSVLARPARLLAAARLGTTRLIDNLAV